MPLEVKCACTACKLPLFPFSQSQASPLRGRPSISKAWWLIYPFPPTFVRRPNRAPTLSYTKQLETRVAQLEDALAKQQVDVDARKVSSPASVAESSSSAGRKIKTENDDTQDLTRDFDGLNVENDGRISFHGPTSLFQLPSGMANETASTSHFAQEIEARKERLINSAWRERAFEQMAAMPVRILNVEALFGMRD